MRVKDFCLQSAVLLLLLFVFSPASLRAEMPKQTVSIAGNVQNELELCMEDLKNFQGVRAQLNDITSSNKFKGVFSCLGVPLKTLLETAGIRKEDSGFSKDTDLGILIENSDGRQVALSWGEVFYSDSGSVLLAYQSKPIIPHHGCSSSPNPEKCESRRNKLKREVEMPRLIVADDRHSNRCLEGVTEIEVIDFAWKDPGSQSTDRLYSPSISLVWQQGKKKIKELSRFSSPRDAFVHTVGEGRGYHGSVTYSGYSLRDLLKEKGLAYNPGKFLLVSAPDGYRSLLSLGEIFLSPAGKRTILASARNGEKLKKSGKYYLIIPADGMADRWVKAVQRIRVVEMD